MSQFTESLWADTAFSQSYRDDADIFLPFRRQFIEMAKSFYGHFFNSNPEAGVLDLGCGDGLFIQELLKSFTPKEITMVDGSSEMLAAARKRLGKRDDVNFIEIDFHKLLAEKPLEKSFDFIYSSLAIHHLPSRDKYRLYEYIYERLNPGGCFIHYDVVVPTGDNIEKWYMSVWREWIRNFPDKERSEGLLGIPEQYKENPDNLPDTLHSQLQALENIGFSDVDCHCKHGIFSLFGGFK